MTVVKINAITVPADSRDELARRFAARAGAEDATARASQVWPEKVAAHEPAALEGAIRDELADFVAKRRPEAGD